MNTGTDATEVVWDRHQSGMVLVALAELPFKNVFEVIGRINEQAHRCFGDGTDAQAKHPFRLSRREIGLCLEALQAMPYGAVREIASRLESLVAEPGGIGSRA